MVQTIQEVCLSAQIKLSILLSNPNPVLFIAVLLSLANDWPHCGLYIDRSQATVKGFQTQNSTQDVTVDTSALIREKL